MRRLIAFVLSLLLALQGVAAAVPGGAGAACACGEAALAPDTLPRAEPHCRATDTASPDVHGPVEGTVDGSRATADTTADTTDASPRCCDDGCAGCDAPMPPAPPSAVAGRDVHPPRQPPAARAQPANVEHVHAVPLRPPSTARR